MLVEWNVVMVVCECVGDGAGGDGVRCGDDVDDVERGGVDERSQHQGRLLVLAPNKLEKISLRACTPKYII